MIRMIAVFAVVWAVMGFDSGVGQIEFPILKVLSGEARTLSDLSYWYNWAYGKYMHWSVFVIYGLMFWGLSRYLSNCDMRPIWRSDAYGKTFGPRQKIRGSRNFAYSFSLTLLSIGIFEYFWMVAFYLFQNQPWILKFQWPQAKLLIQNFGLTFVGVLCLIHIYLETTMKPRVDWKTGLAITLAVASCLLWIYYPWQATPLQVETTTGTWTSTSMFPQTVYTIDVDPLDGENAGVQFYIEDNLIHLVNTVAKVFVTLAVMVFGLLVPKNINTYNNTK